MTQERIDAILNSSYGAQVKEVYVTSDDRVFLDQKDAEKHANGEFGEGTQPLPDKTITKWLPSWLLDKQEHVAESNSGTVVPETKGMTQAKADRIFESSLGEQLDMIYATSDGRPFIRWEEADKHTRVELD